MTEELKQKAIDFIRKTKGREYHIISDTYTDEQIERFYENEINLMIGFATEATKELQDESCIFEPYERKIKNQQQELRKMNKEREHLLKVIHKKNLECMRLVRRRKELLDKVEKMKCCSNCKHFKPLTGCMIADKPIHRKCDAEGDNWKSWELVE